MRDTLHRIYIMLYLQFVFYWATIAFGMVVNYYYAVPDTLQPNFFSIFGEVFSAPYLLIHGIFGFLSTFMSVPVIFLANRLGLRNVIVLHIGAILTRMGGFIGGPLFLYFSTSAIDNGDLANLSTFVMASAFMLAVSQSFLSRIFIVREEVELGHAPSLGAAAGITTTPDPPKLEEKTTLGLSSLRFIIDLCYANFVVYLLLYFTGMFINIYITSGVQTINIGDPINIFHVVATILNMAFSFALVVVGILYAMRRVAIFSLGAVTSIAVASVGGLVFLATGGGRTTGSLTLLGGWVMSLLFMLAFFLAYYSTLRVMKAIRILEAEEGEGATGGGANKTRIRYWMLAQIIFLASTYAAGVLQALGVGAPGIASIFTETHAFFAAGFGILTLVVGLLSLFRGLKVVSILNLSLFFGVVLGGSSGLAFLGNTSRVGGAGIANSTMMMVIALAIPITGYSLSRLGGLKVGRLQLAAYSALGMLSFTLMAGVGVTSSGFSAAFVPIHVVFAGLTVLFTAFVLYYVANSSGTQPSVTSAIYPLLALLFVSAAAGMGAAFLLGGPLDAARGMAEGTIIVYVFLALTLWPADELQAERKEELRLTKALALATVVIMGAGTFWAWALDPVGQQVPFAMLVSSDLVGLSLLAYLWLGSKYGGTKVVWVSSGLFAFLALMAGGVLASLLV